MKLPSLMKAEMFARSSKMFPRNFEMEPESRKAVEVKTYTEPKARKPSSTELGSVRNSKAGPRARDSTLCLALSTREPLQASAKSYRRDL